ncbi:hypothetical protein GCM10010440_00880 [Kitasatospora cinereorecta]
MAAMTQRSSRPTLKQRFSPHPANAPRTGWQRFNRAKTDSGWPLLLANLAGFTAFSIYSVNEALAGSLFFSVGSITFILGALRTGHVMLCVAQGKTGITASGEAIPAEPSERDRLF